MSRLRTITGNRWVRVGGVLAGVLIGVGALRPEWLSERPVGNDLRRARFADAGPVPFVLLDDDSAADLVARHALPVWAMRGLPWGAEAGYRLGLAPGAAAALTLDPGERLRVWAGPGAPLPYVVLGWSEPVADAPGQTRVTAMQYLDVRDGQLILEPWTPNRSWRLDASWLAGLARACAPQGGAELVVAREQPDLLSVQLGACAAQFTVAPKRVAEPSTILLLSATDVVHAVREPPLPAETILDHMRLAASALLALAAALVLSVLFGWPAMLIIMLAALATGLTLGPVVATIGVWLLALLGGVIVTLVTAVRDRRRLRPRLAALSALLAVTTFAVVLEHSGGSAAVPAPPAPGAAPPDCLVAGGAATAAPGAVNGERALAAYLAEKCATCAGGVRWIGAADGDIAELERAVCDARDERAGAIVFAGGTHDDFAAGWGWTSPVVAGRVVAGFAGLFAGGGPVGAGAVLAALEPAAAASLRALPGQEAHLRAAAQCARQRGARLVVVHDFLITDLGGGRSLTRAALARRRGEAVAAGGGRFVDALTELTGQAGVAWFDGPRQFSPIGHRQIADYLCLVLAE